MNQKLFVTVLLLLSFTSALAQEQNVRGIQFERQRQLDLLVDLVKNDRIGQLADRVSYPLRMPNPVPNITTREEFVLFYPTLFDDAFKQQLTTTVFDSTNTIDKYTGFGLFRGSIWLDDEGFIQTINHISPALEALSNQLQREQEQLVHLSVKHWNYNLLACETTKFFIRIDEMPDGDLRYVSWSTNKAVSEQPDLVLFKGKTEFQGTMGGVTYTFHNGDYAYVLNYVGIAESVEDTGLFLEIYHDENQEKRVRCFEVK